MTETAPKKPVSDNEIKKLREAIEEDKLEKQKHKRHKRFIAKLQRQEKRLNEKIVKTQEQLKGIQTMIVAAFDVKFDYSDDISISAAEATLKKLENENKKEELS
jgi:hypothetical protein